ncbi:MAG: sensor histidine kinase [Fimbriiglobus sp.]
MATTLFIVLVALVVSGLGFVTTAALQVEDDQRTTAERAERANRERLALWRLDGLMLPTLGLENHRPFAHYTPFHAAPSAVDFQNSDRPADVRLPSPLLSADLPPWMLLHFQLDPDTGWESPQVLPNEYQLKFNNQLWLNTGNDNNDRRAVLQRLKESFTPASVIRSLTQRDNALGNTTPFIVPVPLTAEPSEAKGNEFNALTVTQRQSVVSGQRLGWEMANLLPTVAGAARSNTVDDKAQTLSKDQLTAAQNSLATQQAAIPQQNPYNELGNSKSAEYDARMRAAAQATQAPDNRGGGFGGGTSGFNNGGFGGGQGGFGGNAVYPQYGGRVNELKTVNPDQAQARNGTITLTDDLIPGVRAAKKGMPTLTPIAVHVSPMYAEWISQGDQELLLFVRSARLEAKTVYQGVVLDRKLLQTKLQEQIADLFPNATLTPLRTPDPEAPDLAMTALPLQLDPGAMPPTPSVGNSPLRWGLILAWLVAILAIVAVGFGGRALLDLSERRIRFVSAVTHELRTPLTSLRLYLDLLNSGLIDDPVKQKEYLDTMTGESERLHRLVENVLDFAKLEKRRVTANLQPTDLGQVLESLQKTWSDRITADGKVLVVQNQLAPSQSLATDARMLEAILGNLIDNARKYSREATDPRIWLRARPGPANTVIFEVEDRGPGIPASERHTIFAPFRRGEIADSITGGAGLGLALAQQWAELLKGRVSHHPANPGALFRLEL